MLSGGDSSTLRGGKGINLADLKRALDAHASPDPSSRRPCLVGVEHRLGQSLDSDNDSDSDESSGAPRRFSVGSSVDPIGDPVLALTDNRMGVLTISGIICKGVYAKSEM